MQGITHRRAGAYTNICSLTNALYVWIIYTCILNVYIHTYLIIFASQENIHLHNHNQPHNQSQPRQPPWTFTQLRPDRSRSRASGPTLCFSGTPPWSPSCPWVWAWGSAGSESGSVCTTETACLGTDRETHTQKQVQITQDLVSTL